MLFLELRGPKPSDIRIIILGHIVAGTLAAACAVYRHHGLEGLIQAAENLNVARKMSRDMSCLQKTPNFTEGGNMTAIDLFEDT